MTPDTFDAERAWPRARRNEQRFRLQGARARTRLEDPERVLAARAGARRAGTVAAPDIPRYDGVPFAADARIARLSRTRRKDRNYRLGVAVLRLGFEYLSSLELTDLGTPIIEELRDETGLTSHIVIRDGTRRRVRREGAKPCADFQSVKVNVGTRLPAHATTHGQVLMGDLTLEDLQQALSGAGARALHGADAGDDRRTVRADSRRRATRLRDRARRRSSAAFP